MPNAIRDASLTTLKRKQRALAAYRSSTNFPIQNSVYPEQVNTKTGDVPVDARLGKALLGCCRSAVDDGYGLQAPSDVRNIK